MTIYTSKSIIYDGGARTKTHCAGILIAGPHDHAGRTHPIINIEWSYPRLWEETLVSTEDIDSDESVRGAAIKYNRRVVDKVRETIADLEALASRLESENERLSVGQMSLLGDG